MTLWISFNPVLVDLFDTAPAGKEGVLLITTGLEWKSRFPTQPSLTLESAMNFSLALSRDSPDSTTTRVTLAPCQLGRGGTVSTWSPLMAKRERQAYHHSLCSPLRIFRSTFIERRSGKHFYNQWRWKSRFHYRHLMVWMEVGSQYCSVVFGSGNCFIKCFYFIFYFARLPLL